jgi:RimJ/RimL family protein N-acetyltransferase
MTHRFNSFGQPIGAALDRWSPRPRPTRTSIAGQYCRIEPLSVTRHGADLERAYLGPADGRDWTYLGVERPESHEEFEQHFTQLAASEDPLHFAIVDTAPARAVGTASLMRIDTASGVIAYSPLLKRSRAGTEAMYLLMRYAFDELGYRRYEWKCDSLNAPSRAAALRYGFTFEGIFRNATVVKGRSRDTAWYSITDAEWPPIRAAFEAWLDPSNFDANGAQKRALASLR